MAVQSWVEQPVIHKVSWFSRRFVASESEARLPQSNDELQGAINHSELVFKHDQTTTVAKLDLPGEEFVLKRYNPRSQWHKVKRALRRSRALRCWRMSYAFQRAGLMVAQPVLMVEQRFGPICFNAFFASRMIPGKELINLLPDMNDEEQRAVANCIKDAFTKMRVAKITHGDMKASNLIWNDGQLFFIDLDAALKHRHRVTWQKSHQKDLKRFMKNWQGQAQLTSLFKEVLALK